MAPINQPQLSIKTPNVRRLLQEVKLQFYHGIDRYSLFLSLYPKPTNTANLTRQYVVKCGE